MIERYRATIALLLLVRSTIEAAPVGLIPEVHQAFSDRLTSFLYKEQEPNECSSSLGVSMAFSLIYPGCTADAVGEVQRTLGYLSSPEDDLVWNETQTRLMLTYKGDTFRMNQAPTLKIANRVYFNDKNPLHPDYEDLVGDYAKQIDFTKTESSSIVNRWVEEKTEGLIEAIVPEGKALAPCEQLAINSIYLKASWASPFKKGATNLDTFYDDASRAKGVSKAHFMNGVLDSVPYSDEVLPGHQVVELPFVASKMSMIIVLPTKVRSSVVPSRALIEILDGMKLKQTRVALSMPKFNFQRSYEEDLKGAIIKTGIETPFNPGTLPGSLCALFEDDRGCEELYIDKVIQKTHIDVNENGVEAAAATGMKIMYRSARPRLGRPVEMMADHTFQFFIYDRSEGLVLFEGRVGKPEVPDAEPEVELLDAKHSDPDFWSANFGVDPIDPTPSISDPPPQRGVGRSEDNTKPQRRPQRRPRTMKVCIDLGRGVGEHTFSIPRRDYRWMRVARNGWDGARRGECDPYNIRRLLTRHQREHKFCRRIGWGQTIIVRAPAAARRWLGRRGITEGKCGRSERADYEIHMKLIE